MFSEKLVSLLANFSKVERNRFRKYLLSPYLNEQEDATRLFDYIDRHLRAPSGIFDATKEQVWKALYPAIKFDDSHLRRLASDLNQLALKFLVAEMRHQTPIEEALDLQKALEKLPLKKQLAGVERQLQQMLEDAEGQSAEYLLARFRMHHHIFQRASKAVTTTGYIDKMAPADFYLECYYLVQKLKFYIAWLQFSGVRTTEKEISFIPGFWEYTEEERFRHVPIIAVYKRVVKCFTEQDEEEHFHALLADLERYARQLTQENLQECYYMAQNYCALKINQGKTDYYSTYFGLQKKAVQLNLLLENRELSEAVFKNIITSGLRVGEFAWTENFIQEYHPYLPVGIRENARTFNLANLYSHQKKHARVIELLSNVEYSDLVYALGSKLILLRTYYESREYLALDSLIDSFRIFVRRNKSMSKSLKREYLNFLNFLSKIAAAKNGKPLNIKSLETKIKEAPHVTSKKWLLEKIDELGKT